MISILSILLEPTGKTAYQPSSGDLFCEILILLSFIGGFLYFCRIVYSSLAYIIREMR